MLTAGNTSASDEKPTSDRKDVKMADQCAIRGIARPGHRCTDPADPVPEPVGAAASPYCAAGLAHEIIDPRRGFFCFRSSDRVGVQNGQPRRMVRGIATVALRTLPLQNMDANQDA